MLVPNWILGGILATTLGLTTGLMVLAEPLAPPSAVLGSFVPDIAADAPSRGAASFFDAATFASESFDLSTLRPRLRPVNLVTVDRRPLLRPMARNDLIPVARWDGQGGTALWTRATLAAIEAQPNDLGDIVPRDVALWCPAYERNPQRARDAFWVGLLSALVKHESRFNPDAVGGGGLYHGLLQILPATARHYGCAATTGQALSNPEANLACAIRIIARTVQRDNSIAVYDGRWRGVAADWGPMTNSDMRAEMADWTRVQSYCALPTGVMTAPRPPERPWTLTAHGPDLTLVEAIQLAMLSPDDVVVRPIPSTDGF